ncbi:MAG: VanZ family protein [Candidatus Bipolaricaulota bacterium]
MNLVKRSLVLGYMGFLAYMSMGAGYPSPLEGALAGVGTRFLHFLSYWLLAVLAAWAMPKGKRRRAWYGAAVSFGYGALLEALQLLVPARAPSALDLGINLAGALTGSLAFRYVGIVRRRPKATAQDLGLGS